MVAMHNSCKDSFLVLCSVNYMRCQRLNQGKSHARQWPNPCTNSLVPIFVILNILILLSFTTLDLKIKTKTRNNYCLLLGLSSLVLTLRIYDFAPQLALLRGFFLVLRNEACGDWPWAYCIWARLQPALSPPNYKTITLLPFWLCLTLTLHLSLLLL